MSGREQATPTNVEGARAFAAEKVRQFTKHRINRSPEEVFLWAILGLRFEDWGICVPPGAGTVIFERALVNQGARDLARFVCWNFINDGRPLPDGLKDFACLAVRGDLPDLSKPGEKRKLGDRDLFIVMMLTDMKAEYGIRPTRNAERSLKSKAPPSGCDILSDAFQEIGGWADVTFDACATAWRNRKWAEVVIREMEEPRPPRNALLHYMQNT